MNTTNLSCDLAIAQINVMAELALIKLEVDLPENDGFSGYIVEGYEFAFLELDATTPLQLSIIGDIKKLMVNTKEFIEGYKYALKNIGILDNF